LIAPDEWQRIENINDTGMMLPATTLSQLVAEQAARTPDAPALADAHWQFSYRDARAGGAGAASA
jgi:enterobactin synthetase component F